MNENSNLKLFRQILQTKKLFNRQCNITAWKKELFEYLEALFFNHNEYEIKQILLILESVFDYTLPFSVKYTLDGYWYSYHGDYMKLYKEVVEFINDK